MDRWFAAQFLKSKPATDFFMKRMVLVILLIGCVTAMAATRSGENTGADASQKGSPASPGGKLNYQTDLFTGQFGYQVPLDLAPGRHGSAPDLKLVYSSSSENGWCGVGWNLDLGYIQRETRHGVPVPWTNGAPVKAYDDAKGFVFSLNGQGSALIPVGNNEYRAEIEEGFLRFQLQTNGNQWRVTDLSGNQYYFGVTNNSRMSNAKSGWSSNAWTGTYRWALARIESVLGDTTDYTYTNTSGMLYPLKISYNGHINGVTATHTVDFILGSRTDDRISFLSGFRVEQDRRLEAVVHKVGSQIVWSNRLNYADSVSTFRSLLQSVTRYGTNLTTPLPPITFNYSSQQFGFQTLSYWTNLNIPSGGYPYYYQVTASVGSRQIVDLLDMDGDGLPDRVFQPVIAPFTNLWVQHNNGYGFDDPRAFGANSVQNYSDGVVGSLTTSNVIDWNAINSSYGRLLDINGDSLLDRVMDPLESLSAAAGAANSYPFTNLVVQLNSSTNWLSTANSFWTNVAYTNFTSGEPAETSYRAVENGGSVLMLDMNGDGLPDRVLARGYGSPPGSGPFTNYWIQFNTGAGFTGKQAWGPLQHDTYTPGGYGGTLSSSSLRMMDLNGDGLPDRVMYRTNATGTPESNYALLTNLVVQFNNGSGYEAFEYWGSMIAEYNNTLQIHYPESGNLQDHTERVFRDINGDGLPDRLVRYWQRGVTAEVQTNWFVQINTGTYFNSAGNLYGPLNSQGQTASGFTAIEGDLARLLDINGDGLPDHVMPSYPVGGSNRLAVELSKGPIPDLLTTISNGIGGTVSISYRPSTQYDNRESTNVVTRYLLPNVMQTVARVSVSDGIYPSNTTTYAYEGGMWNSTRREFHGFSRVRVADPLGMTNVHWFHQSGGRDNSTFGEYQDSAGNLAKKGMEYRSEAICTNGILHQLTLNKVEDVDLGNGRHFAYVSQSLTVDYPGNTNAYRAAAKQFTHDLNTGNLTNTVEYGEVTNLNVSAQSFSDVSGDTVYQLTTFSALANTNILDKPQRTILSDNASGTAILREKLYDYDDNVGLLTRQRDRICPGSYLTNMFAYDAYGNQTSQTNEAGIVTSTAYESTYQAFPSQQTAGGTFTTTFIYDARSGQPLSTTDAKGLVTSNRYDVFLRPIETLVSTTSNGPANLWLRRYDYRLGMASGYSTNSVRVRNNDGVDVTNGHETWSYSDGMGRALQTRVESETNSTFRVTDVVYDKRGNPMFETLPYFSTGTNFTKPASTLGTLRVYDPCGRLTNITASVSGTFSSGLLTGMSATGGDTGSPVGSMSLAYADGNNPWAVVTTDEESKIHKYLLDAFGRTNQVVEVTGGGNFTTTLRYDKTGLLTNLIDHAGNVIEYAYNDLGQLAAMADPDLGVWQYQRDFAGRVRRQIDANSNAVVFAYNDSLGRLKSRQVYDFTGAFIYGVTNIYDSSDDANFTVYPGQLYRTTDAEGWTKNSYDVRGRLLKTARYISKNGNTYANQFTLDDADRVTQTVYPNGGPTVTNIFDAGGNLSQVKQVGGNNTVFWTARSYTALGQLVGANFGNSTVTTNDYFPNSKRLRRVVTFKTGSTNIQDLGYTFDKVSNLKSIADAVYASTASAALTNVAYDDLHRLTSLTRPATAQTTAFSFDAFGNIVTNGEAGMGVYNYSNRLPHAVKSANNVKYAYDACGNMLVRGSQRLAYDPENRLAYVATATAVSSFGYDAAGARLWKQASTNANLQVWVDGNYEEKNGQTLFHILAAGKTVCTFDKFETNVFEYYHPDHLNSTSVLTDRNGNRIQHHEYTAFGKDRFTESSTAFPLSKRYTSQVLDEDTGLYFYGARYYDPQLGRFIQPDTIIPSFSNPQHLNRYAYCLNNPLRYTDPSGHEPGDLFTDQPMMTPAAAVAMSKAAAPMMVGGAVAIVTGGAAAPWLAGSASPAFVAIGSGMIGGAAGDLASQTTQIGFGQRNSISGQEVATSTLVGGALGLGLSKLPLPKGTPTVAAEPAPQMGRQTMPVGEMRAAGLKDAHHVIQDAAVRDIPGYNTQKAPGLQLPGPSTKQGSPHYKATQVQRQAGGGNYGAERRIGYKALREAGVAKPQARQAISEADAHFQSIGVGPSTKTRIPGNRD